MNRNSTLRSPLRGSKALRTTLHRDDGIMVVPSGISKERIRTEMKRIIDNDKHQQTTKF